MSQLRRKARQLAAQALYQWELAKQNVGEVEAQFQEEHGGAKVDWEYFHDLLFGVTTSLSDVDTKLSEFLDRALDETSLVERAILRMSFFELMMRPDVPYRVIINEAVDITKKYGSDQGHRYVNGILDKAATQLRGAEVRSPR
ncbi:MAG: transcription antitermination factor NusB [Gammaproteobacteria bacterium]|nr:transcription antitermination factor NusB [Gammaproteobacteria bacterium]MDH5693612.1 transcription antitermination factor NusB [Gammaproteobacteria bacterium]